MWAALIALALPLTPDVDSSSVVIEKQRTVRRLSHCIASRHPSSGRAHFVLSNQQVAAARSILLTATRKCYYSLCVIPSCDTQPVLRYVVVRKTFWYVCCVGGEMRRPVEYVWWCVVRVTLAVGHKSCCRPYAMSHAE